MGGFRRPLIMLICSWALDSLACECSEVNDMITELYSV